MEKLVANQGLWHIAEKIFGHLSYQDLKNCCKVSSDWNDCLTRHHGILPTLEQDLSFIQTTEFEWTLVNAYGWNFHLVETTETGTLFGSFPDLQVIMDHFQNKEEVESLRAFVSELKIMIAEWKDGIWTPQLNSWPQLCSWEKKREHFINETTFDIDKLLKKLSSARTNRKTDTLRNPVSELRDFYSYKNS